MTQALLLLAVLMFQDPVPDAPPAQEMEVSKAARPLGDFQLRTEVTGQIHLLRLRAGTDEPDRSYAIQPELRFGIGYLDRVRLYALGGSTRRYLYDDDERVAKLSGLRFGLGLESMIPLRESLAPIEAHSLGLWLQVRGARTAADGDEESLGEDFLVFPTGVRREVEYREKAYQFAAGPSWENEKDRITVALAAGWNRIDYEVGATRHKMFLQRNVGGLVRWFSGNENRFFQYEIRYVSGFAMELGVGLRF